MEFKKRTLIQLAGLIAAVLLVGAFVATRATSHNHFQPPPAGRYTFLSPENWAEVRPSQGFFRRASVKVWQPRDARRRAQTITLAFTTTQDTHGQRLALDGLVKDIKRQFGDAGVLKSQVSTACNGTQKVIFVENRAAIAGFATIVDQVQAPAANGTYIVTYTRPAHQEQDSAALNSLFSICTK